MSVSVKIGSTWRNIDNTYVRVGGTWRKASNVFTKVAGQWKPSYAYTWNIGAWSACSVSCGGGIQSRVVTCVRNDGKLVEDLLCGSRPVTSQVCNTHACQPVGDCRYVFTDDFTYAYYWMTTFDNWNSAVWGTEIDWLNYECFKTDATPCILRGYKYYRGILMYTYSNYYYYQICREPV